MDMLKKLRALSLVEPIAVVGVGESGKAVLHYLQEAGYTVSSFDENNMQDGEISFDNPTLLQDFQTLVISPGIDRRRAAIARSSAAQINDLEIFARLVDKPILAVTGSNGKSTVVSMLTHVLTGLNKSVRLCGNIGCPVMEALFDAPEKTDVYVVELSSYQLELCPSLVIDVGGLLNITPDHLDRYDGYADYIAAKENLIRQAKICIINADDKTCMQIAEKYTTVTYYGRDFPNRIEEDNILIDNRVILSAKQLSVHGRHNLENVLVTLLMLSIFNIDIESAVSVLSSFKGLAHRMSLIAETKGVLWLDDSKATNIGATAAALAGVTAPTWLIVGGLGKGQDFSWLAQVIQNATVKGVLVIGVDNRAMLSAFDQAGVIYHICHDMSRAVAYAKTHAQTGDWVLLSPATASFDQFSGYAERGDRFKAEVVAQCQT